MIALFAAEGEEADALVRRLISKTRERGPFRAFSGQFAGKDAVIVQTFPGKAAAAAAVAWALTTYQPQRAFFAGVAGALSPELEQGELLVALDAVHWDVDLTPFGREPGELATGERFIPSDPQLAAMLEEAANARVGRIATGDRFVADPELAEWIRETFHADAVDMEGASALWTARRYHVPMTLLRVISDNALWGADADFASFLVEGSERMASALEQVIAQLP